MMRKPLRSVDGDERYKTKPYLQGKYLLITLRLFASSLRTFRETRPMFGNPYRRAGTRRPASPVGGIVDEVGLDGPP